MAQEQLRTFLDRLRRVVNPGGGSDLSDAQLLERFVSRHDEAAPQKAALTVAHSHQSFAPAFCSKSSRAFSGGGIVSISTSCAMTIARA